MKFEKRQLPPNALPDRAPAFADAGVKGRRLEVRATSCCKYYEPFFGGADNRTCIACKYSSDLGECLRCEHPANRL